MGRINIALFIILTLSVSCTSNTNQTEAEQPSISEPVKEKPVVEEKPLALEAGKEARTRKQAALWTDSELKVLEGPDWPNAVARTKLNRGVTVYVMDIGAEYARVKTILGSEGHIVKDLLSPVRWAQRDSTEYFKKKQIGRINTYVDGMDVRKVNLWAQRDTKDRVVTSTVNNERVGLVEKSGMYVKVMTENGKVGWCLKDFVRW